MATIDPTTDLPYAWALGDQTLSGTIVWPGFNGGEMYGHGVGDFTPSPGTWYGDESRVIWSGADDGGPMIELKAYGARLRDFMLAGNTHSEAIGGPPFDRPSQGILTTKQPTTGGAGKCTFSRINFAHHRVGVQFGSSQTESQSDFFVFESCEWRSCDIAVKSMTQNAMNNYWRRPIFRNCPIAFDIQAGGCWQIDTPTILSADHVFLDYSNAGAGIGTNNGTMLVNNLKADEQFDNVQAVKMTSALPLNLTFNSTILGNDDYMANGNIMFDIYSGAVVNLNGFENLQEHTIRFTQTGSSYPPPIFNITGGRLRIPTADPFDVFDFDNCTGHCYVYMQGNMYYTPGGTTVVLPNRMRKLYADGTSEMVGDMPTVPEISAGVLDTATIEGQTVAWHIAKQTELLRAKTSGNDSNPLAGQTEVIRNIDDTADSITIVTDESNNRTTVTDESGSEPTVVVDP